MKPQQEELRLLLRSRFPIILVETAEEQRFHQLIENIANLDETALFTWSVVRGLSGQRVGSTVVGTRALGDAISHLVKSPQNGIFVFFDAQPHLDHPEVVRMIREVAMEHTKNRQTLIFVGTRVELHPDLQRMSAAFRMPTIGPEEVRALIKEEAELYMHQREVNLKADRGAYEMLVQHLVGLSRDDARRMIRQSIEDEGAITMEDVARVLKIKHNSLGQGGTLQMVTEVESLDRVGGQARFKKWLELRRDAFLGSKGTESLDAPKGVMLLGVQGAGKSLAARAVAGSWRVPLLRLDFGALYNKFHGETERNLRSALETAAQMSPCILWMDEVEKGVSSSDGSGDGGVSRRVLGTLLTWMSERRERVFLIATANDIASLPPELLRKGRFDEIFFVDLPHQASRGEIFRIHLARRKHPVEKFDLATLGAAADGFSGAEIEQAIVAAAYTAHSEGKPLETRHIVDELRSTRPLSVVRAEEVAALRKWAERRTVPAD
ncbi:MAG TPA: AAA family ATPase [Usitatibacter sp.]|nr:AAA family ATPase [Usitatibacter sp.]